VANVAAQSSSQCDPGGTRGPFGGSIVEFIAASIAPFSTFFKKTFFAFSALFRPFYPFSVFPGFFRRPNSSSFGSRQCFLCFLWTFPSVVLALPGFFSSPEFFIFWLSSVLSVLSVDLPLCGPCPFFFFPASVDQFG
jgi:hypothetical protein